MGRFQTLEEMIVATAEAVRPPERLTVSQAAEKYRYINNPGSYVGPMRMALTPYLREPLDMLMSLDFTGMIFVGPAQCAKPLALDTPIATPSGWTTMAEVQPGDEVFTQDGTPTTVVAKSPVKETVGYRVTFDDGEEIVCDGAHPWPVCDMWAEDPTAQVRRTTEYLASRYEVTTKTGHRFRFSIPVAEPLNPVGDPALPIPPYTLGAWLGDGNRHAARLTLRAEDAEHIASRIDREGVGCRLNPEANGSRQLALYGQLPALRETRLLKNDKRIPRAYLRASVATRRKLAQGLLDTDGTVAKNGRVVVAFSEKGLADDTTELLTSLGVKVHRDDGPTRSQSGPGKHSYRMSFCCERAEDFFSLPRHVCRHRAHSARVLTRPTHSGRRFVRKIEPVGAVAVQCLTVADPSHVFLAGRSMVPTCNSDMSTSWLTYSAVCDPADFMHIGPTQSAVRDWQMRRVDKLFRDSEEVGRRLMPGKHNTSTYSTRFTSGMLYTNSWPSVTELAGKPIGRLWLADYDRMEDDIGGEGSPYDLASQRMKSFGRRGMCAAESSPSRLIEDPRWMPKTPHEAPPTTGILALYNRGDRRRWMWPCLSCGHPFEPDFDLFSWPGDDDLLAAAEQVVMKCPHCSHEYREHFHEASGTPGKRAMNERGFWLRDGQKFDPETGEVTGEAIRSRIASFWLKGPAAAFADWTDMTLKYLKAVAEFEATGSEEALKTTVNTDQGKPYLPAGIEAERLPEELKARAQEALGERVVPEDVRFLIATVDVQKTRFECQVHGIRPHGDVVIIDRFKIRKSARVDEDGDPLPLNPGSYVEDWHLLVEKVLLQTYDLGDGSGRTMQVRMMAVDSGGSEGVTANAYEFWRQLRSDGRNLHRRVQLLKGEGRPGAPLVRIDYPNAERKDRRASARGEVPVMLIHTDSAKDLVNNMLGRTDPGGGMVFFPAWLPDWWYVELTAESRTAKGWVNPGSRRNEAFDLLVYCMALCHSSRIRLPHIAWDNPPSWAAEWDNNDMVGTSDNFRFDVHPKSDISLKDLAAKLG